MKCPYCLIDTTITRDGRCSNCGFNKSKGAKEQSPKQPLSALMDPAVIIGELSYYPGRTYLRCPRCTLKMFASEGARCSNCGFSFESLKRPIEDALIDELTATIADSMADNYTANIEASTRMQTVSRYEWESEEKKKSYTNKKQYQVSLEKILHMDVPGVKEAYASIALASAVPIGTGFLAVLAAMKEDSEKRSKKSQKKLSKTKR